MQCRDLPLALTEASGQVALRVDTEAAHSELSRSVSPVLPALRLCSKTTLKHREASDIDCVIITRHAVQLHEQKHPKQLYHCFFSLK